MEYYSMNDYCRQIFGKKLYKLSLDAGFTCPNRDGTLGIRGCIFCSAAGSGDFAEGGTDINQQIENAKKRIASKNKNGGYIAYFQSFTNTYGSIERMKSVYLPVINREDIDVLSIATRPDCIDEEKADFLGELNKIKPVWVELGLQTVNEKSIDFIRRGYETPVYGSAVKLLKDRGIYVITHVILGLPGESIEDMKNSVLHAVTAGTDGIKLQLLHVLKDTDLYEHWKNGEFKTLELDEYLHILSVLLPLLPKNVAVHRLTGDGNKKYLAAPMWSADKKNVINRIKNYG